jgi:oligoendopeptidase F
MNRDLQEYLNKVDKQILSQLKPLVNNHKQLQAFNNYLDELITQQHRAMEQTENAVLMHRSQGAIAVLRKLKLLRDEVNG